MYDEMVLQDGALLYFPSSSFPSSLSAFDGTWSGVLNCNAEVNDEQVRVLPIDDDVWTVSSGTLDANLIGDSIHVALRIFTTVPATISVELWDNGLLRGSRSIDLDAQVVNETDFTFSTESFPSPVNTQIRVNGTGTLILTFDYIRILGSPDNAIQNTRPVHPAEIVDNEVVVSGRTVNDYITIPLLGGELAASRKGTPLHKHAGSSVVLTDNAEPLVIDTDIDIITAQATLEMWLKTGTTLYPQQLLGRGNDGLYVSNSALVAKYRGKIGSYDIEHIDMAILIHMVYGSNELRVLVNGETVISLTSDIPPYLATSFDFTLQSVKSHVPTQISSLAIYPYAMTSDIAKKHYIVGHGGGDLSALISEYGGRSYTPTTASLASNNYLSIRKDIGWGAGQYEETLQASDKLRITDYSVPEELQIAEVDTPPESPLSWAFVSDSPVTIKRSDTLSFIRSVELSLSRVASLSSAQAVFSMVYENNVLEFLVDDNSVSAVFNGDTIDQVANSDSILNATFELQRLKDASSQSALLQQVIDYGDIVIFSTTLGVAISALGLSNESLTSSNLEISNKALPGTSYLLRMVVLDVGVFIDISARGRWTARIPFSRLVADGNLDYLQFSTSRAVTNRSLRIPYNVLSNMFPGYQIDQLEDFVTENGTVSVSYDNFVNALFATGAELDTASEISYSLGVEGPDANFDYSNPSEYQDIIYPDVNNPDGYYFDNGSIVALLDTIILDRLFLRINIDMVSSGAITSPIALSDIGINTEVKEYRKFQPFATYEGSVVTPANSIYNFGRHQNFKYSKVFVKHPLYRLPSFCKGQYSGIEIVNPDYIKESRLIYKNVLHTELPDEGVEAVSFWIRPHQQLPNIQEYPLFSLMAQQTIFAHAWLQKTNNAGEWRLGLSDKDGWQSYNPLSDVQFMINGDRTSSPRLYENRWYFVTIFFPVNVKPNLISKMALQCYGGFGIDEFYIHKPVAKRFRLQSYQRAWYTIATYYKWQTVKTDLKTWSNVRYGTNQIETEVPFKIHERILGIQEPIVFSDTDLSFIDEQYYITTGIKW